MNNTKNIILLNLLLYLSSTSLVAQFRLPSMDIQVKSGVTIIDEMRDQHNNLYTYQSLCLQGEINFNISQYLAAGAFFSTGVYSNSQTEFESDFVDGTTTYPSAHQLYGIKVRLSTGRQPRFRPFAELSYGKFEMYIEKDIYRISSSSTFIGGSVGLMIRLNNKFYLVLPQVTVRPRSDSFYFEVPGDFILSSYPSIIEITGGISYNFGKKK